jgi:hypothetical protein
MDRNTAVRLLAKLKVFADDLDADERELLGQLLAPGIARAYDSEPEVSGFAMTEWSENALPDALVDAIRSSGVRLVWHDAGAP